MFKIKSLFNKKQKKDDLYNEVVFKAAKWGTACENLGKRQEKYCIAVSLGEWDAVSSYKEAYDKAEIEQRLTMDEFLNALNEYSEF